jgi:ribonuclease HII
MARLLIVCGVDEAGRGPLAGPVYAAAVVLNLRRSIPGIDDSKKLAPAVRLQLAAKIKARAHAWQVASASVEEIDRLNILQASMLAMRRAVEGLSLPPEQVLVDGPYCPVLAFPACPVVGGDAEIEAIAAASIIAKTERDAEMMRLHEIYPQYGLDQHKGYGTRAHFEALQRHGICDIHRRSFDPVRKLADQAGPRGEPDQADG